MLNDDIWEKNQKYYLRPVHNLKSSDKPHFSSTWPQNPDVVGWFWFRIRILRQKLLRKRLIAFQQQNLAGLCYWLIWIPSLTISLSVSARILVARADHNPVFCVFKKRCYYYLYKKRKKKGNNPRYYPGNEPKKTDRSKKSLAIKRGLGDMNDSTIRFSRPFAWSTDANEPIRARNLV